MFTEQNYSTTRTFSRRNQAKIAQAQRLTEAELKIFNQTDNYSSTSGFINNEEFFWSQLLAEASDSSFSVTIVSNTWHLSLNIASDTQKNQKHDTSIPTSKIRKKRREKVLYTPSDARGSKTSNSTNFAILQPNLFERCQETIYLTCKEKTFKKTLPSSIIVKIPELGRAADVAIYYYY